MSKNRNAKKLHKHKYKVMSTYPEVIGLGEVLIDFIASEPVHYTEASTFIKCFGDAPMNTIVGVARLGVNAVAILYGAMLFTLNACSHCSASA